MCALIRIGIMYAYYHVWKTAWQSHVKRHRTCALCVCPRDNDKTFERAGVSVYLWPVFSFSLSLSPPVSVGFTLRHSQSNHMSLGLRRVICYKTLARIRFSNSPEHGVTACWRHGLTDLVPAVSSVEHTDGATDPARRFFRHTGYSCRRLHDDDITAAIISPFVRHNDFWSEIRFLATGHACFCQNVFL